MKWKGIGPMGGPFHCREIGPLIKSWCEWKNPSIVNAHWKKYLDVIYVFVLEFSHFLTKYYSPYPYIPSYLSRISFWIVPLYLNYFPFWLKIKQVITSTLFFLLLYSIFTYFILSSTLFYLFNSLNITFLNLVLKRNASSNMWRKEYITMKKKTFCIFYT